MLVDAVSFETGLTTQQPYLQCNPCMLLGVTEQLIVAPAYCISWVAVRCLRQQVEASPHFQWISTLSFTTHLNKMSSPAYRDESSHGKGRPAAAPACEACRKLKVSVFPLYREFH